MVFSEAVFLLLFLPIVTLLYYIADEKYRNYLLLIASIIFYSVGEPKFVFVMLLSIVINYILANVIEKNDNRDSVRKISLVAAVVINIGLLFVYKYLDFAIGIVNSLSKSNIERSGIALPIGISFFTFQALSYVIDVYKRDVKAQKNLFYVALYISFFPQLIAGPIIRYQTVENQIKSRSLSFDKYSEGVRRFIVGLGKKVLLANNLAIVAEEYFGTQINSNPVLLWIASICFSLQIYFDFSGYSDMAIGLGLVYGFDFPKNFNYPYISKSITDFWRRWHISLSSWFRDYVYIPLGGSRVKVMRHFINMLVVWLLTGLWHGANWTFIVWGALYFVMLVIEKYLVRPDRFTNGFLKLLWRIVTLLIVNFGWVLFNSADLSGGLEFCGRMIGIGSGINWKISNDVLRIINQSGVFIIAGIILSTPILTVADKKMSDLALYKRYGTIVKSLGYCLIFLLSVTYIVLGAHNPFLYFNF